MDVFAEDSNNIYLKELHILDSLQTILPQLKTKVTIVFRFPQVFQLELVTRRREAVQKSQVWLAGQLPIW